MSSQQPEKRFFLFAAYLQIIGIVLVVFGHSFHLYPGGTSEMLFYRMMYSFRMPVFMFTSGFLMAFTTSLKSPSWQSFAMGKVKRLLIPYIVLTLVTFVPRSLMSGMADDAIELSASGLINGLIDGPKLVIPYFWFIHSSFVLLLTVYALLLLSRKAGISPAVFYPAVSALILLLNFLPVSYTSLFSLNRTVTMAVYFIAGCIYSHWQRQIDAAVKWQSAGVMAVFAAAWCALFFLQQKEPYAGMLCSLAGIMMVVSAAKILEHRHITVLDHLIGANYIIFLLSWYFNVATQQVLSHYVALPWWVHTAMSLLAGIYVPWLFYKWMLRHPANRFTRFCAFLLGQSLKSPRK
ncbi:MAG: acyltransferase [Bacteroides sp.]|nr:acyltransferase [Bacteroides sp.]